MRSLSRLSLLFVFVFGSLISKACQCPLTTLGIEECDKYEIIFKGKILSVAECGDRFGEAIFEIEELYKGSVAKKFKVLFECKVECAQKFNPGEEWIIYSKYKQVNSAMMNWCSRSRKYFKNEKEDFYTVTYGNDYYDEVKFLRENLGQHRYLVDNGPDLAAGRNPAPTTNQLIMILICSIGAIVLFYWLFNKFFR